MKKSIKSENKKSVYSFSGGEEENISNSQQVQLKPPPMQLKNADKSESGDSSIQEMGKSEPQYSLSPNGVYERNNASFELKKTEPEHAEPLQAKENKQDLAVDVTSPIQMVRENEFRDNPEQFLQTNVLSLTMPEGMTARSGENETLTGAYGQFVRQMGRFSKHWFKLTPDAARTTDEQNAYILTPAIEKYMAEYPEDELLQPLIGQQGVPNVEEDGNYISSAYVEYHGIGVEDLETTVGHADITQDREAEEDFNPDFVFTAAMNGCAFTVTPSEVEGKFKAWHFQSPTSNRDQASDFRRNQSPMDWYGPDEYDDGQHEGLFEVTNFLHRGQDNQWNVISQQNETSSTDFNDISIKNVDSRPLNLGEPDEAGIIKRIYLDFQETKNDEIRRAAKNARLYLSLLAVREKAALQQLVLDINRMLLGEQAVLSQANTLAELYAAGNGILDMRTQNIPQIRLAADALIDHLEDKYNAENGKWKMFKSVDKLRRIGLCQRNLTALKNYYANTVWITQLINETEPGD